MSPAALAVPLPPSDVRLRGETVGDSFDRAAAADPERDALVEVRTTRRWMTVTGKTGRRERSAGIRRIGDAAVVRAA